MDVRMLRDAVWYGAVLTSVACSTPEQPKQASASQPVQVAPAASELEVKAKALFGALPEKMESPTRKLSPRRSSSVTSSTSIRASLADRSSRVRRATT